jgi:hypothetical protein
MLINLLFHAAEALFLAPVVILLWPVSQFVTRKIV